MQAIFFCCCLKVTRKVWFKSSVKSNPENVDQKNSPCESRLICASCVWTQSLLQTMSPWLLPLPLWLYPVSCRAQTLMPAMGVAPCPLFLHSAPSKLRRPPPPSSPISGSSNRRNRRMAIRWTKRDETTGSRWGRLWIHQRMDELCVGIHKCIYRLVCKCTYIKTVR